MSAPSTLILSFQSLLSSLDSFSSFDSFCSSWLSFDFCDCSCFGSLSSLSALATLALVKSMDNAKALAVICLYFISHLPFYFICYLLFTVYHLLTITTMLLKCY